MASLRFIRSAKHDLTEGRGYKKRHVGKGSSVRLKFPLWNRVNDAKGEQMRNLQEFHHLLSLGKREAPRIPRDPSFKTRGERG